MQSFLMKCVLHRLCLFDKSRDEIFFFELLYYLAFFKQDSPAFFTAGDTEICFPCLARTVHGTPHDRNLKVAGQRGEFPFYGFYHADDVNPAAPAGGAADDLRAPRAELARPEA